MDVRHYAFLANQPSAVVQNRERFWGMPKRGLAFLLANVMFWQPVWAQADGIVVATPGTSLDHAGNGVPIVNVATPNGSGLSHNQFVDYNVGAQGVILNNGAAQTSATQLGGIIIGNPHLVSSGSAQTILNEVIGGSPSQLRGYTEVAGQSARVIVANPYGITCNGCGFINTPRVTLTTGKPVLDGSGRVDHFQVDQGSVSIEGDGLNADNVDRFEIITRSARINAEIQAKNLTIIAGRNDVNADNLNASARADDGSAKPQLAIDSSALGGMYAGAIKLVGTEAGVGVKLAGNVAASGGDIQIDANGHLSLAQTSAAGAVSVKAASLETQGPVYGGSSVNVQTQGDLTIQQTVAARDSIALSAGGQLTNNGIIEAGVNADNSRNANGDVSLIANSLSNNGKTVVASRNLTVNVAQALSNQGGAFSAAQLANISVATLDNVAGLVNAGKALSITASGTVNNRGGQLASLGTMSLAAGKIDNSAKGKIASKEALTARTSNLDQHDGGELTSDTSLTLDLDHGVLNNQSGVIKSPTLLLKNLAQVDNRLGEISSAGALSLVAEHLNNSDGKLFSQRQLDITADSTLNLNGLISGWQGLSLLGGSLDNRNLGTLSSRDGDVRVNLSGAVLNSNAGALVSQGTLSVTAASLDNSDKGILSSVGVQTLVIDATLDNGQGGLIDSGAGLDIQAKTLNNANATINAQQDIAFTGTDLNNSAGTLAGNGAVTLDLLGTLTNTHGQLASLGPMVISRANQINNQGGTLASQGLLKVLTGGFDNRNGGTVAANNLLTLTASGAVQNSADGLIFSRDAGLTVTAASLDNAKGSLQSQGDLTVISSGAIDNQSASIVAKAGNLDITAAGLDSRGGVLSSLQGAFTSQITGVLRNGYDLNNNRQGGIIQAQNLNLRALAGIDNYGGRITAQTGDAIVDMGTLGNFDNRNGALYAKGQVSVSGNNVDNVGQIGGQQIDLSLLGALNNRQGIIESETTLTITAGSLDNQTGQLRALGDSGKTKFTLGSLFDNRNGTVESANSDLTLDVGGLLNAGGTVLHVGSGIFDIALGQLGSAGGTFVTRGDLTLSADAWTNSSVIQAEHLTVNVNNLSQTGSGQLLAVNTLSGHGGTWYNDGLIASDGSLSLDLAGSYSGNGRISSLGTFDLSAAQLNLSAASSLAGGGDTTIAVGGLLSNAGRLTSAADLTLTAGAVNNSGTVGAGQNLTLTTGALRNDHGLIFSGADMQLLSPSFTNSYGQVYSLGSALIARDQNGNLADLLDNRSAGIESAGNLTIAAMTVNNVMDVLQYTEHEKSVATITSLPCEQIPIIGCDSRGGGRINGLWEIAETDRLHITFHSEAATINSGANLLINAGTLNNTSSSLTAAGNLTANATTINNQGLQAQEIKTTRQYVSWVNETGMATQMANTFTQRNNPTASATVEADMSSFLAWMGQTLGMSSTVENGESLDAIIQAGGNVTLNAAQNINNSVVRPYYAYVAAGHTTTDTGAGSGYSTPIYINAQLPPDLAQQQVNPIALPGFSLPTGENGLFRLSSEGSTTPTGPQSWGLNGSPFNITRVQGLPSNAGKSQPHKYLIETNPALTDLKQFMSSDYLLSNLGYDPDISAKRLGDGLYEQRLIQQAVVARTGQRFIDGQTSDEGLFKYLMNNAVASKTELNLSLGVSLTSEQVAALTHDIVWLEDQVVNGEHVLVPVLYLANANNRLADTGALIQGSDVTLIAGKDLNNSGTLKATNNLAAVTNNDLVTSGLVEAGNRLDLLATNNLTNKAGGIIAGRDVSLTAVQGDVINERTVTTHESTSGNSHERTDFVDNAARIEAANDLTISAGRDVNNRGGVLSSGADTAISAGRDVNITSVEQVVSHDAGVDRNSLSITQLGANVTSGNNLSISAGHDLNVIASQIEAKRDIDLEAGNDLTLASAADEQHSYNKTKKDTNQEDHVHQVGTSVKAGGNITLKADNDLTLVSSNVDAGNEAYLSAGNRLSLLAAQDTDYTLYDMKKKGSFGSKKTQHDEVTDIKNIGSQIKTGGDLTLVSGGDQLYQGAKLESGGDLTLDSGGSITFEAVKDVHKESHDKSSSSAAWTSMESKGQVDETLRQSQLTAKGQTLIKAVDGLHIDINDINQQSVSQAIDAMVHADPSMAWLKDVEARGDVDWRKVKELHDSWDESHSGLGGPAMIVVIIIVSYFTAGAASSAIADYAASVGASSAFAAGAAATAASEAVAAGWANAALTAMITSAASTGAVSVINNKGDLGAAFKETFSADSMKNYIVAGAAAGLAAGLFNDWTSTTTDQGVGLSDATNGALANTGKVAVATPGGLSSLEGITKFTENQLLQNTTSAVLNKALGRDGSLGDAVQNSLVNAFTAYGFNLVGDIGVDNHLQESGLAKIGLHALMGGLASLAAGEDFKTGALAAGVNEALVDNLASAYAGMSKDDRDRLLLMNSQLIGVLTTAAQDPTADIDKLQLGSSIAQSGTLYNRQLHPEEEDAIKQEANKGDFKEENLEKAACYIIKCWAVYARNSAEYNAKYISDSEILGLSNELAWAEAQQGRGLFNYSRWDGAKDFINTDGLPIAKYGSQVLGGGLSIYGGATLCGGTLGLGCFAGGGAMTVFGTGNMVEGGTGLYTHFASDKLNTYNPVKEAFNSFPGGYGPIVYSGLDFATSVGTGFAKVPLKMGLTDGLNRPKSMFGVLVNKADNNYFLPITNAKTPYGSAGAIYLYGVGLKGYDLSGKLYSGDGDAK